MRKTKRIFELTFLGVFFYATFYRFSATKEDVFIIYKKWNPDMSNLNATIAMFIGVNDVLPGPIMSLTKIVSNILFRLLVLRRIKS